MRTKGPDNLYIRAPRLNRLNILNQLASETHLTQAELARRCRLSVAMVNNYMKELCGAGLLEYRRRSSKTVTYHLTPAGQRELSLIRNELLEETVDLFSQAKELIRNIIIQQAQGMLHRVILFGNGNLAELAVHALESADVSLIGVCSDDPSTIGREWCGREIFNVAQIRYMSPDAVIVATSDRANEIHASLKDFQDRGIQLICLDGLKVQQALQPSTDHLCL